MDTIFDKNQEELIKKEADGTITGREHWTLAIHSQRHMGFDRISPMIRLELQRGAEAGDVWCMCELAREYYRLGDELLPEALFWWKKAIEAGDNGAVQDLAYYPFEKRILEYKVEDSPFAIACTKIAMLSGFYLFDFGKQSWKKISDAEKQKRLQVLLKQATGIAGIGTVNLEFVVGKKLQCGDVTAAGVADPANNRIQMHESVYQNFDIPYVLQVLFHEMGHFVSFAMQKKDQRAQELMKRYQVTQKRIDTYYPYTYDPGYPGSVINTLEEDADSWGYTTRMIFQSIFCK